MLNKLRHVAMSKEPRYIITESTYTYHDENLIFYQKGSMLVGLNGHGTESNVEPYKKTIKFKHYATGDALVEVLSCADIVAGPGQVVVNIKDGAPIVLYPGTLLAGSGICGL